MAKSASPPQYDIHPFKDENLFYCLWAVFNRGQLRRYVSVAEIAEEMNALQCHKKSWLTRISEPRSRHLAGQLFNQKYCDMHGVGWQDYGYMLSESGRAVLNEIFERNHIDYLTHFDAGNVTPFRSR